MSSDGSRRISSFGQLWRLWTIYRLVRRYGLDQFAGRRPNKVFEQPPGVRLRLALEEMGPVFVKFGQALSTRPDLLPAEIAQELAKLQDAVPPFASELARDMIERSLGRSVDVLFAEFDDQALASASVAQVHAARLHQAEGGMDVVVKVLRPGIAEAVRRDIDLMYAIAGWVERFVPRSRRLRPLAVVAEYEKVIFDELDLVREGANASQLRRNWLGSDLIYHPLVFWDYTRDDVLVLERINGIAIDEVETLRAQGVDFQALSERGVEIFFKQVFRDNFFHADMHPGNIFVDPSDPAKPRYLGVDFGIVGTLTPNDQRYLAENFVAFFDRDYRRVAELHIESGWVPADTRIDEFESAIRAVSEPIFQKPLKDISFGAFLLRLFQTARRFEMEVQPQLVLLQKTLLNIEGLGRQLYPELDLWKTAKPIMEDWMRQRLNPANGIDRIRREVPRIAEAVPGIINRLQNGPWPADVMERQNQEIAALRRDVARQGQRMRAALMGTGFAVAAAFVMALDGFSGRMIADVPLGTWILGVLSGWFLLRSIGR